MIFIGHLLKDFIEIMYDYAPLVETLQVPVTSTSAVTDVPGYNWVGPPMAHPVWVSKSTSLRITEMNK